MILLDEPKRPGQEAGSRFDDRLWQLASTATALRGRPGLPTVIQEAVAGLQALACQFAPFSGPHSAATRVAGFRQQQADTGCAIQASINGPLLVTNAETLENWLGERIPAPRLAA